MLHGLILYPRATCSTVGPGVPTSVRSDEWLRHGQVVVSLHRGASAYAYGQFPMYPASKPTIGGPLIDPTIPHSPNSMNPTRPTTARNDADVGRIRLCTEVDSPILPRRAKLAESEESRSVRARPWFDSLQSPSGFSSYPFNPEKFHN